VPLVEQEQELFIILLNVYLGEISTLSIRLYFLNMKIHPSLYNFDRYVFFHFM
jgi:hypothetical protein